MLLVVLNFRHHAVTNISLLDCKSHWIHCFLVLSCKTLLGDYSIKVLNCYLKNDQLIYDKIVITIMKDFFWLCGEESGAGRVVLAYMVISSHSLCVHGCFMFWFLGEREFGIFLFCVVIDAQVCISSLGSCFPCIWWCWYSVVTCWYCMSWWSVMWCKLFLLCKHAICLFFFSFLIGVVGYLTWPSAQLDHK
jgi:hypothetical protein